MNCLYCQGTKYYKAKAVSSLCGFCNGTGIDQGYNFEDYVWYRKKNVRLVNKKEPIVLYLMIVIGFLFFLSALINYLLTIR